MHHLLEPALFGRLEQVVEHRVDEDLLGLRGGEGQDQQLGGLLGAQDPQGLQLGDRGKRDGRRGFGGRGMLRIWSKGF